MEQKTKKREETVEKRTKQHRKKITCGGSRKEISIEEGEDDCGSEEVEKESRKHCI